MAELISQKRRISFLNSRLNSSTSFNILRKLTTDKKTYNIGETVTFTIENNGDQTLEFSNGIYGLQIKNLDTGKNCDRISTTVVTELRPGKSIKQNWDQKCSDGKPVKSGKYNARVASGSLSSDTTFNITESSLPAESLKVIVTVEGKAGPGKISIKSEATGRTISRAVDDIEGKHTFNLDKGDVPVGRTFIACAYSDILNKEYCTKGKNGPENEPEKVTINFPRDKIKFHIKLINIPKPEDIGEESLHVFVCVNGDRQVRQCAGHGEVPIKDDTVVVRFVVEDVPQGIDLNAEACGEWFGGERVCETVEDIKRKGTNKVVIDMSKAL